MFDKVKSITLKVTLLFPITELVIHINIECYSMKESTVCCRKKDLLKAAKIAVRSAQWH